MFFYFIFVLVLCKLFVEKNKSEKAKNIAISRDFMVKNLDQYIPTIKTLSLLSQFREQRLNA